ncbi:MAG TPA: hypothetical protein VGW40_11910 [Allosphingosinicella sp.]|nr:hypothetical protein [Allosphingosinicella sp.]
MSDKDGCTRAQHRLPVWHAFSDLFLDTELQPGDYRRIADVARRSGYSPEELRLILESEVARAFAFNFLDVAGEWTSWSEDEVREIMARSERALPPMRWLRRRMFRRFLDAEWRKISALLEP